MSTDPIVLPAVDMNDELAKSIKEAVSGADIRTLILDAAQKQADTASQLAADQAAADKIAADQAAEATNQNFTRTVEIGGKSFTFEGASEAEIDRLELNALKVAYAVREPEAAVVEVAVDPAEATRAAEAEVVAKVELDRKFRAGEITSADYIQQSGAMKEYLAKEGISVDSLKAVVETTKERQYEQSWEQAGERFKVSDAGADWPGGLKNQELLGLKIVAMGLMDAPDKLAAISQAYAAMKQTGLYFPNGDGDAAPIVAVADKDAAETARVLAAKAATDAETTRAAAAAKVQSMSSSIFGASSGMSGAPVLSPAVVDAKKIVPPDATPAEIMQAWKESQVAQGKDINATFLAENRGNAR